MHVVAYERVSMNEYEQNETDKIINVIFVVKLSVTFRKPNETRFADD